ncbi:hypothetical protein KAR91_31550 [Candidatus Pacearchaeota archaeon]|nr:hypothetical protein [Candidatus Pacearchaeota archaeon]
MLTLFILKSGSDDADPERAIASFGKLPRKVVEVNTLKDVDRAEVETKWYGICYDDEQVDKKLKASFKTFLSHSDADVLMIYKKLSETSVTKSPRLFRKSVSVRSDCLLPEREYALKMDTILNGWII